MTNNNAQELLKLKNHIEKSKNEAMRLEGQLEQLLNQREQDFGVATDEEAEKYLEELATQESELSQELSDGISTVKDELGW